MAIATAAKQVVIDRMDIVAAGRPDSISLVQTPEMRISGDPSLIAMHRNVYMPMLGTAETVAQRYGISREAQDEYSLQSQQRTAAPGRRPPVRGNRACDHQHGHQGQGNRRGLVQGRPSTRTRATAPKPRSKALPRCSRCSANTHITAGNASQLSDGSSACVIMDSALAEKRGLEPLGRYIGMAVAGRARRDGHRPGVRRGAKLLKRFGLKMDDIGLWELNEAFAVQVLYCRDKLGIPNDILNVDGGAISIGHPYGMSGARLTGHA